MARKNRTEEAIETYIKIPVIMLLGLLIVGAILDGQLHTTGVFTVLFPAFGGVGLVAQYYREHWLHDMKPPRRR